MYDLFLINYMNQIDDFIYKINSSNIIYVYGGVTTQKDDFLKNWLKENYGSLDFSYINYLLFEIVLLNNIPIEKYKIYLSFLEYYLINKLKEVFGFKCINPRFAEIKREFDVSSLEYGETYSFYVFIKPKLFN